MRTKIADRRGASILIALFFALVVALVVAVVLSFSVVNGERTKQHATEEQAYFAVQSAMGEADSLLGTQNAMHVVKKTVDGERKYVGSPGETISKNDEFAAALAQWCTESVTAVSSGDEVTPYVVTAQYTSTEDGSSIGSSIQYADKVSLKFEMDDQYNITVTAWQGKEEDLEKRYTLENSADYNYPLVQTYLRYGDSLDDITWVADNS